VARWKGGRGTVLSPGPGRLPEDDEDAKPVHLKDKRMDEREAVSKLVREGDYVATDMYGMVAGRCP